MLHNRSMSTRLEIQTACFVRDTDRLHKESPAYGNGHLIFIIVCVWGGGGGERGGGAERFFNKKKQDPILAEKIYLGQSRFYFTILRIVIHTIKKTGPRRERKIISRPGNIFQHPPPLLKFKWSLPNSCSNDLDEMNKVLDFRFGYSNKLVLLCLLS